MQVKTQTGNVDTQAKQRNLWAAVWRGLVIDSEGRHYNQMQKSVWLFLYLLQCANWDTGLVVRRDKTIAVDTGIKERTLRSWLIRLRHHNYIAVKSNGRG